MINVSIHTTKLIVALLAAVLRNWQASHLQNNSLTEPTVTWQQTKYIIEGKTEECADVIRV